MTTAPPLVDVPAFQRLDPRIATLWRVSTALNTLFWAAVVFGVIRFLSLPLPAWGIVGSLLAAGAAAILFYVPAKWCAWEFQVGDADVRLRHGVFWRTESVVPHVRIQHVDTAHGPVERGLGLASVIIYTAGTVGGALTIPGLALAEAEVLRDRLAALSGRDDAV
ncbi:MAG TPA: PH domain-containing protein [Gemmatimonadaceae bacterium]|nr:PH domain-containing protein [Gemmatimonadaceae bacterium]